MKATLYLIDGRSLTSKNLTEDEIDELLSTIKHPDSLWVNVAIVGNKIETIQTRHIVSFRFET